MAAFFCFKFIFAYSTCSVFMNLFMRFQVKLTVIILLFFPILIFAQNPGKTFIEIPDAILAADISPDGKKIVCSTKDYIYNLNVDDFEITDSVRLNIPENFKVSQVGFINSNYDLIRVKTMEAALGNYAFRIPFFEYPKDSVFIYNLKIGQKTAALAGNFHFSGFHKKNDMVVGYNDYFEWTNDKGEVNKSSKSGELALSSMPDNRVPSNGIIKKVNISPDDKTLAIVYFDSISKTNGAPSHYSLELRSLPELEVIRKTSFRSENEVNRIVFSRDSKTIFLDNQPNDNSRYVNVERNFLFYDENLQWINNLEQHTHFTGFKTDDNIWMQDKNEILETEPKSGQVQNQIWANLTPFGFILNFYKINENDIIIIGNANSNADTTKNGIELFSLKDNAVYTKKQVIGTEDVLYDPHKMIVQNNLFNGTNIQVNEQNKILLTVGNPFDQTGNIQLWDMENFRKLYELKFDEEIYAFLNSSGKEVLIFEKFSMSKNYSDFLLKVLDIPSGKIRVQPYIGNSSDFSLGHWVKCYPKESSKETWICSSNREEIYQINTKDLSITPFKNFNENKKYKGLLQTDILDTNNDNLLLRIENNIEYTPYPVGIFEYNLTNGQLKEFPKFLYDKKNLQYAGGQLVYSDSKGVSTYNPQTGSENLLIKSSGTQSGIIKSLNSIFVKNDDNLYQLSKNSLKTEKQWANIEKDGFLTNAFAYQNDFFAFKYQSDEQTSFLNRISDHGEFLNKNIKPQTNDGSIHTIQLSKEGVLLFKNHIMLDLNNLEVTNIYGMGNLFLLDNANDEIIYAKRFGENDYNKFKFCIAHRKSPEEIIWESEAFSYSGNYFSPTDLEFTISENGKYVLAKEKTNSTEKGSKSYYFIDTQKRNAIERKAENIVSVSLFYPESNAYNINGVIYDINTHQLIKKPESFPDPVFKEKRFLTTAIGSQDLTVYKKEADGSYKSKRYYARKYLGHFSGRSNALFVAQSKLLVAASENHLIFWKEDVQSPFKTVFISPNQISEIKQLGKFVYVLTENNEIHVVDTDSLKVMLSFTVMEKNDRKDATVAWFTPEGYFSASKADLRNFHFVQDFNTFSVHSYELFLNRPDIILQRLGFADKDRIELYHKAFVNRLTRSGFSENTDFSSIDRPVVKLLNRSEIPFTTMNNQIELELEISGNSDELIVYCNGVPVLEKTNLKSSRISEKITLLSGENNISIITKNKIQIESNPVSFVINNQNIVENRKVHYFGIGVSKYQDSTMNLNYADKDVLSLDEMFQLKYKENYTFHPLLNQEATRENILSIKNELMQTDIEDIVIVSLSGHGVMNDDSEFYFATRDMNFEHPEQRGLSYNEIRNLLSDIPARRKMLLIDACHSGEYFPENQETETSSDNGVEIIQQNVIGYTSKGSRVIGSGNNKSNDEFTIMQNLFFELDRGNGAFIIAAAGGREYAYEGDQWKNGIFTYSLINGLLSLGQNSKKIPISKLKEFVNKKVTELTKGNQKPTSRSENIEWDWEL